MAPPRRSSPPPGGPDLRTRGHRTWAGSGVARTPAPGPAPFWSAEAVTPVRPEPLLQRLLTRTARSQAPGDLRDPRHHQQKQQRASRGGPDGRHVRAGRVRSCGMLGPSLAAAAARARPRLWRPRTVVIGCGALKPRPRPHKVSKTSRGAATRPGPRLFVLAQLCVGFSQSSPGR